MQRWIIFSGLLALAGIGVVQGLGPEDGVDTIWLSLTLVAVFAASDASFWKSALAERQYLVLFRQRRGVRRRRSR
jgi:hypothetical protein